VHNKRLARGHIAASGALSTRRALSAFRALPHVHATMQTYEACWQHAARLRNAAHRCSCARMTGPFSAACLLLTHNVVGLSQKAVGDHIASFVAGQGDEASVWERRLWRFVSQATENQLDGEALQKVYVKLLGEPLAPSRTHGTAYQKADVSCFHDIPAEKLIGKPSAFAPLLCWRSLCPMRAMRTCNATTCITNWVHSRPCCCGSCALPGTQCRNLLG
jgi:hypothetical protein